MKKSILTGVASIGCMLLALTSVGTGFSMEWEGKINETLGIDNVIVKKPENDTSDTAYFKSEFGDGNISAKNQQLLLDASKKQCYNEVAEGAVLMRNKNRVLPLTSSERKITVFGNNAANFVYLPSGGGEGNGVQSGNMTTFYDVFVKKGFSVNPTLWDAYTNSGVSRHYDGVDKTTEDIGEVPLSFYTPEIKASFGNYADAAVIVLSRESGEGADMWMSDKDGKSKLALTRNEEDMLKLVTESGVFKKTVVIVNTTNQLELGDLDTYGIDACLWVGSVGQWGAEAIPDLLTGEVDPSGSLPDTWATNSLSAPACVNSGTNTPTYTNLDEIGQRDRDSDSAYSYMSTEVEGIYVGYRYYETRYEDEILGKGNASSVKGSSTGSAWNYADEIVYPYGHGLSYTDFAETLDSVSDDGKGNMDVQVTVKNTGGVAGKKAVQLYAQTPYGEYEKENGVEKSAIQLVQFAKTDLLEPGESQTLDLKVDKYLLASYDAHKAKTYVLSEGDYFLSVGNDAHDALNNILARKSTANLIDEDGNTVPGDSSLVYKWSESFDDKTYSVSRYTGNTVANVFDDCDLNHFYDHDVVTYLSRSDWGKTYPTMQTRVAATQEMIDLLIGNLYEKPSDSPSLSKYQIGVNRNISLLSLKGKAYDDGLWDSYLSQYSLDELGQITAESSGTKPIGKYLVPHLRFIDGPMGLCGKLPFGHVNCTTFPCMPVLAATMNKSLIQRRGELMGEQGLFGGMHVVNGPGLNLHRTPFNGRSCIYFSEDPILTYLAAEVENRGITSKGVSSAVKHFVLNDQEFYRQGVSVFFEEQGMREIALRAFESSLNSTDNTFGSMMSFNRIGCVSDNNCSEIKNLTREEWGYHGFFQTDAAQHYSIHYVTELASGTNLFSADSTGRGGKAVVKYINENDDGALYLKLKEAVHHLHYAIVSGNGMNGISPNTVVTTSTTWWQVAEYVLIGVFAFISLGSVTWLALDEFVFSKKKKAQTGK